MVLASRIRCYGALYPATLRRPFRSSFLGEHGTRGASIGIFLLTNKEAAGATERPQKGKVHQR